MPFHTPSWWSNWQSCNHPPLSFLGLSIITKLSLHKWFTCHFHGMLSWFTHGLCSCNHVYLLVYTTEPMHTWCIMSHHFCGECTNGSPWHCQNIQAPMVCIISNWEDATHLINYSLYLLKKNHAYYLVMLLNSIGIYIHTYM